MFVQPSQGIVQARSTLLDADLILHLKLSEVLMYTQIFIFIVEAFGKYSQIIQMVEHDLETAYLNCFFKQ